MILLALRRLSALIPITIAIVFFAYLGMNMIGRVEAEEPEPVFTVVEQAGKDAVDFFSNLLSGDLGEVPTISGDRPVGDIVWPAYKNSLGLLFIAIALAAIMGMIAGSLAALLKFRGSADTILFLTIIGISIPSFLVAVLLQELGIRYTVHFGRQLVSMGGYEWDFRHLAMPVLVLASFPLAYITRTTYIGLNSILEEDYIRTAYAKGLTRFRTVSVHAFSNLAIPLITAVGVSLRFALSTLVIVEFIFAWPGVGLRILDAVNNRTTLLVVGFALLIGVTLQVINMLIDVSYRFADPRIRESW